MRIIVFIGFMLSALLVNSADRRSVLVAVISKSSGSGSGVGTPLVTSTPSGTLRGAVTGDFTGCLGFSFVTDGNGMTVTALGLWVVAGNTGTHTVSIHQGATVIVSATIDTSVVAPGWNYTPVLPVVLSGGSGYVLVASELNGGDQFLDSFGITTTAEAGFVTSAFASDCASFNNNAGGESYVGVNLKYQ